MILSKRFLVIAESPLQLINANEYLNATGQSCTVDFYILSSRKANNLAQLKDTFKALKLKGEVTWIVVEEIDKNKLTRIQFYLKVIKVAKRKRTERYNTVVVGHISSIYQIILANSIESDAFVYVDDGTATYREQEILKVKKRISFSPLYKRIFPMLLGLSANIPYTDKGLHIYTMYKDVIVDDHPYLRYQVNDLGYLKKTFRKKSVEKDCIFFLGQPFYWKSTKRSETQSIFEQLGAFYSNKKVIYFPHRYENPEHFDWVKNLGWDIKVTGLPIELSLIEMPSLPEAFGMFSTSAFYTINRLLPNMPFVAFKNVGIHGLSNGEGVAKLYQNFEQIDAISIVQLRACLNKI